MDRRLLAAVFGPGSRLALEADLSDADLLARFAAQVDGHDAAFAEVVRRHGPMVWGVCRRLLPEPADAEDAFQATFLALVKSPRSVRRAGSLPGWLYGVAVRAAAKLKRSAVRARQREARAAVPEGHSPVPDSAWDAAYSALQDEVGRLPAALRTAFLVCDVGGVAQPEAARQLGWKLGTLSGRLSKARQRLAAALSVRGIGPAAAAAVLAATPADGAAVPWKLAELVTAFGTSAGGTVPAAVLALATEATIMGLTRLKLLALTAVAAGGVSVSVGPALLPRADAQGVKVQVSPVIPERPAPSALPAAPDVYRFEIANPATKPGWEYEYADVPRELAAFKKLLADRGKDGWEYAGNVTDTAGRSRYEPQVADGQTVMKLVTTAEVAVFKRPTGGATAAAPPALSGGTRLNVPVLGPIPVEPNYSAAVTQAAPPDVAALQAEVKRLQAELAKLRGPAAGGPAPAVWEFSRTTSDAGTREARRVLESMPEAKGQKIQLRVSNFPGGWSMSVVNATPDQAAAVRKALEKLEAESVPAAPPVFTPAPPRVEVEPPPARKPAAKDAAPAIIATRGPADAEFIALIDAMLGDQSATVGGPVRVRAYGAKLVLFGAAPDVVGKVKKFAAEVEEGDVPAPARILPSDVPVPARPSADELPPRAVPTSPLPVPADPAPVAPLPPPAPRRD